MRALTPGRISGGRRLLAAFAALAAGAALFAIGADRADAFGTYNKFGQQAEHERITRVIQCGNPAQVADCVQGHTMDEVAGSNGSLGAVGKPDDIRELYAFPYAHCDGGDYFERTGYPQTLAKANEHLQRCAFAAFGRMNAAVDAAGKIVDPDGRLRVGETNIESCGFPSETTSSTADSKTAKCQVVNQFGRAMHAIEDFWSHSNWADTAAPGTISIANPTGLGRTPIPDFFRYGLSGSVASAGQLQIPASLISGCDDSSPTEVISRDCGKAGSAGDRVKHSDLNKDRGTIDPRTGAVSGPDTPRGKVGGNFAAVVTGARAHVAQSWADLTAAIRTRYPGERGETIVRAIATDTPWTRCRLSGSSANALKPPVGAQSSTRATNVRLQNQSGSSLSCVAAGLDAGEWASVPPDEIAVGASARFRTQSDLKKFSPSTKGSARFAIGTTGYVVQLDWENPFAGSNRYDCRFLRDGADVTSRAPFTCKTSGGSGNDASPEFTIRSRSRGGDAAPLPGPEPRGTRGEPGPDGDGEGDGPRPDPVVLSEDALDDCGGYARNFSLHVDDQDCDRALNKVARAVEDDDVCIEGWRQRRNVRIEGYNEDGDRGEDLPPLVLCVERDADGGDGRDRFAFQVLAH